MADEHVRESDRFTNTEQLRSGPPAPTAPLFLPKNRPAPPEEKDTFREIVETVVFVVVLVLLLKAFIAEAFVIPTGSMATTLLGYHKNVTCPACGYHFEVNCSKEADAQEPMPARVVGCQCPNCRLRIQLLPRVPQGDFP